MSGALELIYHFFNSFISTLFSLYFFPNVSLGMFFFVCIVFSILLHYVIAVPKFKLRGGARYGSRSKSRSEKSNTQ